MKSNAEIELKLKVLASRLRQGLCNSTSALASNAKIHDAIAATVKAQYVKDLKQMLRNALRNPPNPNNPRAVLARHNQILLIKEKLSRKGEEVDSSLPMDKMFIPPFQQVHAESRIKAAKQTRAKKRSRNAPRANAPKNHTK